MSENYYFNVWHWARIHWRAGMRLFVIVMILPMLWRHKIVEPIETWRYEHF